MGIKKQAVLVVIPFMVMACGAERNTPFNSSSSSNSSSNSSSSSSSKSSAAAKILKVSFNESGCIAEHNADATTEFDAFGGQRKMFAWNCVKDEPRTSSNKKLNLVYSYDLVEGCYKKDSKNSGLLYGGLSTEVGSDCSHSESAVLKPIYAAEIIAFNVNAKVDQNSSVGFSFNYSWKNTGTLPLSQTRLQIKIEYADGEKSGQFFERGELNYQSYIFPSELINSTDTQNSAYYLFENFKPNQLYNVSISVLDYYGATLATIKKQVIGN